MDVLSTDTWGDHVAITLHGGILVYRVTERYGDTVRVRRFLRWNRASDAYDDAVDNAERLVDAANNGIPSCISWPPE